MHSEPLHVQTVRPLGITRSASTAGPSASRGTSNRPRSISECSRRSHARPLSACCQRSSHGRSGVKKSSMPSRTSYLEPHVRYRASASSMCFRSCSVIAHISTRRQCGHCRSSTTSANIHRPPILAPTSTPLPQPRHTQSRDRMVHRASRYANIVARLHARLFPVTIKRQTSGSSPYDCSSRRPAYKHNRLPSRWLSMAV